MGLFLFDKTILKKPAIESRDNILYGFMGDNNTGKSVVLSRRAKVWRDNRDSEYKIIAHDPQGRFQFADYFIDIADDRWAERLIGWKNILLILDDFKLINENPTPMKGLNRVFIDRFKNNVDMMYSCHNPKQVLNSMTYYTSHYHIFYGNYKERDFQEKIPNYNFAIAAAIEVNNYVHRFGRGSWPECDFPYVVLNNEKRSLTGFNMNKQFNESLIR